MWINGILILLWHSLAAVSGVDEIYTKLSGAESPLFSQTPPMISYNEHLNLTDINKIFYAL